MPIVPSVDLDALAVVGDAMTACGTNDGKTTMQDSLIAGVGLSYRRRFFPGGSAKLYAAHFISCSAPPRPE
jgi:hypothetical protein